MAPSHEHCVAHKYDSSRSVKEKQASALSFVIVAHAEVKAFQGGGEWALQHMWGLKVLNDLSPG